MENRLGNEGLSQKFRNMSSIGAGSEKAAAAFSSIVVTEYIHAGRSVTSKKGSKQPVVKVRSSFYGKNCLGKIYKPTGLTIRNIKASGKVLSINVKDVKIEVAGKELSYGSVSELLRELNVEAGKPVTAHDRFTQLQSAIQESLLRSSSQRLVWDIFFKSYDRNRPEASLSTLLVIAEDAISQRLIYTLDYIRLYTGRVAVNRLE